ncbi:MAG: hypothetical protein EOL97_15255 [Spirochaetia bacterium]|nr:hypothetical protein [Spirochaetia bacterium]
MVNRTIVVKKNKTTGVVLAIFFGIFAWIYTWKLDQPKFWGAFIAAVLFGWTLIVPIGLYIWVIIDMCAKPKDQYINYHKYKVKR